MSEQSLPEIIAQLGEIPLFKNFPAQTLERIASKLKKEIRPKGAILFRKGGPGDKLYVITSGQVSLLVPANGAGETVVAVLREGEVFGEMSLLTDETRHVTARLDTTSSFLTLDKEDFNMIMEKDPTLALHLSRILSRRLAWTNENLGLAKPKAVLNQPRLYFFLNLLDEPKSPLFALNLSVSLLEQTRRKVAVLEFCVEQKSPILGALQQSSALPAAKDLKGLSLREMLRRLKNQHPSGLDILSIPSGLPALMENDSIIAALNYLRSQYDYVLTFGSPLSWESIRPVLTEADYVYSVSLIDDASREGMITKLSAQMGSRESEGNLVREILIAPDGRDSFFQRHRIRIGWSKAVERTFEEKRNPFEAMIDTKTMRAIERVARILGNLKIGIALGAGGALGYSITGVLKVLAREKIYPDVIAGTSIGSIAGALLAKGMTPEEMIEFGKTFNRKTIRDIITWDLTLPKGGGFLAGLRLSRFLRGALNDLQFEDLELPFHCVASDIHTGEEVILSSGSVLNAIRASISVPLVFKPHKIGERYLVDGGVVNPVPTSVLVQMGADILISIQLTHSPAERSLAATGENGGQVETPGLLDVFFNSTLSMMHRIAMNQQDLAHVNIHPKAPSYHWTDFERADELIAIGEQAAEEALPKIKALLPFYSDYCATRLKI